MAYYYDDYTGEYYYVDEGGMGLDESYYDPYSGQFTDYSAISGVDFGVNENFPGYEYDSRSNTYTYTDDDGSTLTVNAAGELVGATDTSGSAVDVTGSSGLGIGNLINKVGTGTWNAIKGLFTDKDGNVNWRNVAGLAGGLASAYSAYQNANQPKPMTGYQGGIPSYTAVRERVADTYNPNRRPGSGGQRYFSDITYAAPANAEAAKTAAVEQATALAAANKANPAQQTTLPQQMAAGGIAELRKGRYLRGDSDGMADKVVSNIDGKQPARLSHGEFVIPADVVSHIGNGNSDAGAKRLYSMMDRIRKARTGTKKQGKQINPSKYMPT